MNISYMCSGPNIVINASILFLGSFYTQVIQRMSRFMDNMKVFSTLGITFIKLLYYFRCGQA